MGVSIRKSVEDRLFLETENGCGLCGHRDSRVLTVHHIEHDADTADNSYDNLIVLCHNCHTMYHQGKGLLKQEIIEVKRRLIMKTLTLIGINALKVATRKGVVVGAPYTLNHLVELGLVSEHEVFTEIENDEGGISSTQVAYTITDKGARFVEKWRIQ